mgnify:CR=1 FL=1
MAKEKIEILKKELEELSQQRNKVEVEDRELEEREKPMQEGWEREKLKLKKLEHDNSEASRKLKTEIEELRKVYLKEPEENLRKAREHVEKLSYDFLTYERLLQKFQASLSGYKSDLLNPSESFNYMERITSEDSGISLTEADLEYSELSKLARWKKHVEKLAKYVEDLEKDVERYKTRFESAKTELETAKEESLKIESILESAKVAFPKHPQHLTLQTQLQKLNTQKQELDIQKRELYSKMYERALTTREKISKLEGERIEKQHKLEIENFKLELGKKLKSQKILSGELSLATTEEEREAVEKVQKNIEKRIEYLQGQINHCEKMIKFNSDFSQEPSSSSSSSSDSSSSLSSSYSSSSSSSSDSATSEMSLSASSVSPMDLISLVSPVNPSSTGSATSEEVPSLGDIGQEGSDS